VPRLSRIVPAGIPVHIIQRENNHQACFVSEDDYAAYVEWLKEYSTKYGALVNVYNVEVMPGS
jgi:putative transposase